MDTTTVGPIAVCPGCHASVRPTNYFCFNCGKNLKSKPPATSITRQLFIYAASLFLPPLGIIWGIRYLRQDDQKSKIIGWVAIILTLLSIIVSVKLTFDVVNGINEAVNSQMQNFQGF